jgi:hypothetical protein
LNKQTSLSNNDDVKPVNIFISVGFVFRDFIVPLLQASSLMYSMFIISKQLRQTVNSTVVSKLLGPCKRDTIIFFIAMMLLVIIINPLIINPTKYEVKFLDKDDDSVKKRLGAQSYQLYAFRNTAFLFYNMAVTCYLSVTLLFFSLTTKQVELLQWEMIDVAQKRLLSMSTYRALKDKILYYQNESYYSTQVLTFTAGVNVIVLIFELWYNYYRFVTLSDQGYTVGDMLTVDFTQLPFLLKGKINL